MKRKIIILLSLILVMNIFAENNYLYDFNSESKRIQSGDLSAFYSKFDWYKPQKKISDSRLTENERKLVQRLLIFETRNEKEPLLFKFPVTAISEVEFMNGELKRQMITIGSYNYYLVYGDPRRR